MGPLRNRLRAYPRDLLPKRRNEFSLRTGLILRGALLAIYVASVVFHIVQYPGEGRSYVYLGMWALSLAITASQFLFLLERRAWLDTYKASKVAVRPPLSVFCVDWYERMEEAAAGVMLAGTARPKVSAWYWKSPSGRVSRFRQMERLAWEHARLGYIWEALGQDAERVRCDCNAIVVPAQMYKQREQTFGRGGDFP